MRAVLGFFGCLLIVAAAMAALAIGLSGLMRPDAAGALVKALGGLAGFLAVLALTLAGMSRS